MENLNKPYRVALIDADSMTYILAYNHKDHRDIPTMKEACDDFLRSIITATGCTHYFGAFSPPENFRHRIYKYAKYKGNRPSKTDFQMFWESIIKQHFIDEWGFFTAMDLEADDVIVYMAERSNDLLYYPSIICTPDKDLSQIAHEFYDYKKNESFFVSKEEANTRLWRQVMMGDTTDNIKGIPGCGIDKANKVLKANHPFTWPTTVKEMYVKYFGDHYGPIIYAENYHAVRMMDVFHPLINEHITYLDLVSHNTMVYEDKAAKDIRANIFQGL